MLFSDFVSMTNILPVWSQYFLCEFPNQKFFVGLISKLTALCKLHDPLVCGKLCSLYVQL